MKKFGRKFIINVLIAICVILQTTIIQTDAGAEKLIFQKTLWGYGGPESRWVANKGHGLPGVELLQHIYKIEVYGPDHVNKGEVEGVVKACVDGAVASTLLICGGSWPKCVGAFLSGKFGEIVQGKVNACLKTSAGVASIAGKNVRIHTFEENYYK